MAVPPLPMCNACRTLTQAKEKTKGQEKKKKAVRGGNLLLCGPRPLPSPEAVCSSFHLLTQTDEQVAVAVKNERRGCGRTYKKAEEEHGQTLLRSHRFDCRDDLRNCSPGLLLNNEIRKPVSQVCPLRVDLDYLSASLFRQTGDIGRRVNDG
jgi:hypothetical protein